MKDGDPFYGTYIGSQKQNYSEQMVSTLRAGFIQPWSLNAQKNLENERTQEIILNE